MSGWSFSNTSGTAASMASPASVSSRAVPAEAGAASMEVRVAEAATTTPALRRKRLFFTGILSGDTIDRLARGWPGRARRCLPERAGPESPNIPFTGPYTEFLVGDRPVERTDSRGAPLRKGPGHVRP